MEALAANVMQFARVLRRAGLKTGSGKVTLAIEALAAIEISRREDVFAALHTTMVEKHADKEIFTAAFNRFWKLAPLEQVDVNALAKPELRPDPPKAEPRRVSDAFAQDNKPIPQVMLEANAEATWSAAEKLRARDFETMSAAEQAEIKRLLAGFHLPLPVLPSRRFAASHAGAIDMRATLRAMVRGGGFELRRRARRERRPPLVVLCDISGSMAAYARMLLHFLHGVANDRAGDQRRIHVFLFGTRLTNVTRDLALRDPDVAVARVSAAVKDWSGGTRIGEVLRTFNRTWSRRVLGQGAVVLLITDGLDRDAGEGLAFEMARLQRSCRRLIWLNPLLRYAGFEAKAAGVRAMLPFVDDFRPVHNMESLAGLVAALNQPFVRAA